MNNIKWTLQNSDAGHLQSQIAENWRKIEVYLQELRELNSNQPKRPSGRETT